MKNHDGRKQFYQELLPVFGCTYLTFYTLDCKLDTCLRLSVFFLFAYYLTTKRSNELVPTFILENLIKMTILVAWFAFAWTLFISIQSVIFRLFLILSLPTLVFLVRTISFDLKTISKNNLAQFASLDMFLITQATTFWILFLWGWKSTFYIATSLSVILIVKFQFLRARHLVQCMSILLFIVGTTLSRLSVAPYSSDYILSYDQIFRGSMATSLTRWGIYNWNFGYGHKLSYHWLGEAITGLIARVGGTSEIESITRLTPFLGMQFFVIVCLLLLSVIKAELLGSIVVTVLSSAFINNLDPISIGTLMGAAFFMLTLLYVLIGVESEHSHRSAMLVALLTGLTLLCQSVLGLVLAMSIIGLFTIRCLARFSIKTFYLNSIILLMLVLGVLYLLFFRQHSLLQDQDLISFNNLLRFPGVPIQFGTSADSATNEIQMNSIFFPIYIFTIYGIVFLNVFRADLFGTIIKLFLIQVLFGFLLLNFIDIGEFTGKFLAPVSLLGTFLGFSTLLIYLRKFSKKWHALKFALLVFVISFSLQIGYIQEYLLNTGEGLLFLFFVAVSFLVVAFCFLWTRSTLINRSNMGVGLGLMVVCSSFFVLHNMDSWRASRVFQDRTSRQAMFGTRETQDCLRFIKENTRKSAVIATSMWRIPGGMDEKYFLTSLLTHRLALLDGPVYSKGLDWPSLEYFENLKNIHTSFSNSFDSTSHDQLVDLGATHFLLDTRTENLDRTWVNFDGQNVVFDNRDCAVIKL